MARLLVFGSVGWDRPIWLNQPLASGRRILGFGDHDPGSDWPHGRLGGAAANASACWVNAGHEAAVWSPLRQDAIGEIMKRRLADLQIDTEYLHPSEAINGATLILIEPDGERTIMFQHSDPNLDRTFRSHLKKKAAKVDVSKVQSFRPDGIFLRSLFDGFETLANLPPIPTIAHWPQSIEDTILPADVLIGSHDDLAAANRLADVYDQGREACGDRLKGVIVTEGKAGGQVFTEQGNVSYSSPAVEQIDATGAGDAFAAGVLDALVAGASLVEAAQHGAIWGATTAALKGCAEPRPPQTYLKWNASDAAAS